MAELKHNKRSGTKSIAAMFPWLKGRGRIEAPGEFSSKTHHHMFPWLKGRGRIEAVKVCKSWGFVRLFPWLKGRGRIEAEIVGLGGVYPSFVSMAERPWPN